MFQVPSQPSLKVTLPLSTVNTATTTKNSMITESVNTSPVSTVAVPTEPVSTELLEVETVQSRVGHKLPFIEANTKEVTMQYLKAECVVPVFSKDNEVTISHPNFIEAIWDAANQKNLLLESAMLLKADYQKPFINL